VDPHRGGQDGVVRSAAWRFVVGLGVVAMLADIVYEGARSVTGPFLAQLGAGALAVGLITGAGEAASLLLRLGSGALADRTRRYWALTVSGYTLTVVTVPVLALAGTVWLAALLIIAERVGKAVRSPAKDTLLSYAGSQVGQGRAFALHEVLDQFGALVGPLLVAGAVAVTGGYRAGFAILAVPGVAVLVSLGRLVRRVPDPTTFEPRHATRTAGPLPVAFWRYAAFATLTMLGYATFGLIGFHLYQRHLVPAAAVPLVYAGAMAVDAVAAVVTGRLYDRYGARVLAVLPLLAAAVPVLAFSESAALALAGAAVWGAAMGVQESTLRAAVADLVPPDRRATAYGVFAAGYGLAWLAGGTLIGFLYGQSRVVLILVVGVIEAIALVMLALTRRGSPPGSAADPGIPSPGGR
jgi:MFS family permease